jgi:hypothetical protein
MFKYVTALWLLILGSGISFAQDWYVGLGTTVSNIPITVVAGYNDTNFGVRFSADLVFVGIDAYGRIPLDEAGSSLYAGGGLGFNLSSSFVETLVTSSASVPLSAEGVLGAEFRTDNVGFFLEYAPVFALVQQSKVAGLVGLFHFRLGLSIHF